jgi:transposase
MKKNDSVVVEYDILQQINGNAAGIDVGAAEIFVAVPVERADESVQVFGTFTEDLRKAADWLKKCQVDTVAMEATGTYWIPLYEILEQEGFQVYLVNARHLKNVTGRKSDMLDCQWIQQLHTYGLLHASFQPSEQISALRSLVRQREMLVQYRSSHIQHMQKALDQMNIKLTLVLSDITGVTGMQIIRAILAGERDRMVLASYRKEGCKHSQTDIAKALDGNYRWEHLFALQQAVELFDVYGEKLSALDVELEAMYAQFDPPEPPATPPPTSKRGKRRKNQAHFDLAQSLYQMTGVDLCAVDGLDALTVQTILSEIGSDMSHWASEKHFAAWLRLCPNNRITGGKVKSRRTQPTNNRASSAFRLAAQSLARSSSALGAFYRRMRARHGPAKAVTATAHRLARIVYAMLKYRRAYVDLGEAYYEQQNRERALRNLQRRAAQMGMRLEPVSTI